jgi:DNA-binding LacI/PurR family transcriptional regulator
LRYLAELQGGGIGLLPLGKDEQYATFLKDLGIPIVTIFNRISDDINHVGIDDRKIMYEAVQYIASKGYQQVVLVQPRLSAMLSRGITRTTICQRKLGYEQGLAAAGLVQKPIIRGRQGLCESFTGIDFSRRTHSCVSATRTRWLVMKHLRESGLSVRRTSVCDGIRQCRYPAVKHPLLTTVEYHVEAMGRQIVDNLCDMIEGKRAEHTHIMSLQHH